MLDYKRRIVTESTKDIDFETNISFTANCSELLNKHGFHQRQCRHANKRLVLLFWKSVANVAAYTFDTDSKGANENKLTKSFHLLTSCRIDFCKDNLIGCIEQQKPFILTYATSSQWKANFEEIL